MFFFCFLFFFFVFRFHFSLFKFWGNVSINLCWSVVLYKLLYNKYNDYLHVGKLGNCWQQFVNTSLGAAKRENAFAVAAVVAGAVAQWKWKTRTRTNYTTTTTIFYPKLNYSYFPPPSVCLSVWLSQLLRAHLQQINLTKFNLPDVDAAAAAGAGRNRSCCWLQAAVRGVQGAWHAINLGNRLVVAPFAARVN